MLKMRCILSKNKRRSIGISSFIYSIIFVVLWGILLPYKSVFAASYHQEVKSGIENFPESYQIYLNKLHEIYPNWTFEAYYTGIDWNDLVANETGPCRDPKNRIYYTRKSSWKDSCVTSNNKAAYVCASEGIIKYYMDPRNFLNGINIFQFEELSYNSQIHTVENVRKTLKNTFLDTNVTYLDDSGKEITKHYAQIIVEAAKATNWSPFQIKTKIIQEVGTWGSDSVTGTYPGYEGYYNFFNYGANDTGDPIKNGLIKAKEYKWNNPYVSIVEGAKKICSSYIEVGQNTQYFFKFDVVGEKILKPGQSQTISNNVMFKHQYMTNVEDPFNQSKGLYNMYLTNGLLSQKINFVIPVYENMPATNKKPTKLTDKDGELYYISVKSTPLSIRNNPSSNAGVIASVEKDEVVAMLQKEVAREGNIVWDKVKLEDGRIGFASDEYLTSCGTGGTSGEHTGIYLNESKTQLSTEPNIKAGDILKQYPEAIVKSKAGKVLEKEEYVATGMQVTLGKDTCIIVKVGDVNEDGAVDAKDALRILRYAAQEITLEVQCIRAIDTNMDNSADARDALRILNYVVGTSTIRF